MSSKINDLLILRVKEVKPKIIELFENMKKDEKLKEIFIRNPWLVLDSIGELKKGHGISQSNRLLFSILSNKQFLDWATNYSSELSQNLEHEPAFEKMQLQKIYSDIIEALTKFADKSLMYSLFGDYNVLENNMREKEDGDDEMPGCVVIFLWVAVAVLPVVVAIGREEVINRNFLGRDDLAQLVDAISVRLAEKANEQKSKLEDPSAEID